MGRVIRRVPVDFDWPLDKRWPGFLRPDTFDERECSACLGDGFSQRGRELNDKWYGKTPFDPAETGSTRCTPDTPEVRQLAERNVKNGAWFYGTGAGAVDREALRLADLFNSLWMHHLDQDDVDALIAADRLWDFTRRPRTGQQRADVDARIAAGHNSWLPYDNGYRPSPGEVNSWSLRGLGHDGINNSVVIAAKCEREGVPHACGTCEGWGTLEAYPGQRAESDEWEPTPPPVGDGWQLWETVSEGSPISPVFPTRDGLVDWLCSAEYHWGTAGPMAREDAEQLVGDGWAPTGVMPSGGAI